MATLAGGRRGVPDACGRLGRRWRVDARGRREEWCDLLRCRASFCVGGAEICARQLNGFHGAVRKIGVDVWGGAKSWQAHGIRGFVDVGLGRSGRLTQLARCTAVGSAKRGGGLRTGASQ